MMRSKNAPKPAVDRKSTRLNSSHQIISYAVFCLKKKKNDCKNTQLAAPHLVTQNVLVHVPLYTNVVIAHVLRQLDEYHSWSARRRSPLHTVRDRSKKHS